MTDDLRVQLLAAGAKLAAADQARAEAMVDVEAALRASHGRMPLKEAASLAGVSRVTAYRLLEDRGTSAIGKQSASEPELGG